ncbi:unnamed protein product [Heterobilharzia americana]|nr:unnamed protein product [Heterobilharzia americana]
MEDNALWRLSLRSFSPSTKNERHNRKDINTTDRNPSKELDNLLRNTVSGKGKEVSKVKNHEDYVDEIVILKRKIALLATQNKDLNSQCRLLKENLAKKDNELTKLINPMENSKMMQNTGGSKQSLLRNIRSLHQKLFKLETQLQEKDAQYNNLVTDMKFTRTEEMRIQLEVAYSEIQRLKEQIHILTLEQCSKKEKPSIKSRRSCTGENNELNGRLRTLGKVIKELDQQKQELIAKNHCLVNKIQKLYKCLSSDMKEDITPYRASEEERNPQVEKSTKSADDYLVATIVESTVSQKVANEKPKVSVIVRQDEKTIKELAAAKTQIENLQHLNKTLSDANEKMKTQYEQILKEVKEQEAEIQKYQKRIVKETGCQTEKQTSEQKEKDENSKGDEATSKTRKEESHSVREENIHIRRLRSGDEDRSVDHKYEQDKVKMKQDVQEQNRLIIQSNLSDSPVSSLLSLKCDY